MSQGREGRQTGEGGEEDRQLHGAGNVHFLSWVLGSRY